MSIGTVGSSTSYDITQMASSLVSSLDSSKDGSVDKSEFVKGMTAIGVSSDDASATFDQLDSAKTGKLTQSSFESALSKRRVPMCVSWSGAIAVSQGHHHSRSLFHPGCVDC